jgi:hypothetical protein
VIASKYNCKNKHWGRKIIMIISELTCLEEVSEATNIVGGSRSLDIEIENNQIKKLQSSGYKVSTQKGKNRISITATPTSSGDSSVTTTISMTSALEDTLEDWDNW